MAVAVVVVVVVVAAAAGPIRMALRFAQKHARNPSKHAEIDSAVRTPWRVTSFATPHMLRVCLHAR
jgi:hypothetical protein